jgi:hypothetical protein
MSERNENVSQETFHLDYVKLLFSILEHGNKLLPNINSICSLTSTGVIVLVCLGIWAYLQGNPVPHVIFLQNPVRKKGRRLTIQEEFADRTRSVQNTVLPQML